MRPLLKCRLHGFLRSRYFKCEPLVADMHPEAGRVAHAEARPERDRVQVRLAVRVVGCALLYDSGIAFPSDVYSN